jgi:hypothetical protein
MSPAPQSTKQPSIWKEFLAVICMMLFLAMISVGLAYHKGHIIWQPELEMPE